MVRKFIALLIVLLLAPVYLIVFFVILFDDGFPILFMQKRIGENNKEFNIFKFRTMKKSTPNKATHLLNNSKDFYNKSGPFLRKYSIDELPQLFNIVIGDLNFIGPRPALYNQDDLKALRTKKKIHLIKPGITGWAQINGRDNISIEEKVNLDYYYMKNQTLFLDFKILFNTIYKILKSEDVMI